MGKWLGFGFSFDHIFFGTVPKHLQSIIYSIVDVALAKNGGFPSQLCLITQDMDFIRAAIRPGGSIWGARQLLLDSGLQDRSGVEMYQN